MLEIFGKTINFIHREKNGRNLQLKLDDNLKKDIYSHLIKGLNEGAVVGDRQAVVGWWKANNIHKNPLLK